MAIRNQVPDTTQLGMKFTVLHTAADTDGKSLDLHWELLPGCNKKDPLLHIHPHAIETYKILEGKMAFFVKDKWIKAKNGEQLSVPVGVTHSFRNPTNKTVQVFNTQQPAFALEHYFEDFCKVLDKVRNNRYKKFSMNLTSKLYLGVLMNHYRQEIIARQPRDIAIKFPGFTGEILNLKY